MKPTVLVDVDGVLCDFVTQTFIIAEKIFGIKRHVSELNIWDIAEFFQLNEHQEKDLYVEINKPGFHQKMQPYAGAKEGLKALQEVADVVIVTAATRGHTWCFERYEWLQDHFGIHYKDIIFAHKKQYVRGDALLDDRPENIQGWLEAHPMGKGLLWAQSWNSSSEVGERMHTWYDVIKKVTK